MKFDGPADAEFFLSAPAGFQPFRKREPVEVYTRKLPHWRQEGCTYFVTFRTADSLPQAALQELASKRSEWEKENSKPWTDEQKHERGTLLSQLEENWLDAGHGACPFRLPPVRDVLIEALLQAASSQVATRAFVCMPNHVHLLCTPHPGERLEDGLKRIKGRSAVHANRVLERQGSLWFDESFDRIVRDREHLWRCLQYIGRNPVKARLRAHSFSRWVSPEWEEEGWQFRAKGTAE